MKRGEVQSRKRRLDTVAGKVKDRISKKSNHRYRRYHNYGNNPNQPFRDIGMKTSKSLDSSLGSIANQVDTITARFFTASSTNKIDLDEKEPLVAAAIVKVLELMDNKGADAYLEYKKYRKEKASISRRKNVSGETRRCKSSLVNQPLVVNSERRSYQTALLELAKKQNIIVHLGTGTGKTLIALLLIKAWKKLPKSGKQVVFIVPSVALALQQSSLISANLPFSVRAAIGNTVGSEVARERMSKCEILVATHGAWLDLLSHYGDLFSIGNTSLLILDEVHNCTGNAPYVSIMENFYHPLPPADRPRVLGLTASPLINVKLSHTDDQLMEKLVQLERISDSKLISVNCLGLAADDPDRKEFLDRQAEERVVLYDEFTSKSQFGTWPPLDDKMRYPMHEERRSELGKLSLVYEELGAYPLGLYIRELCADLSTPYFFTGETEEQLNHAQSYLRSLVAFCDKQGRVISNKVFVLKDLLHEQLRGNPKAVGLVFVQTRATALALNLYFRSTSTDEPHSYKSPQLNEAAESVRNDQFDDADEGRPITSKVVQDETNVKMEDTVSEKDSHPIDNIASPSETTSKKVSIAADATPPKNDQVLYCIKCDVLVRNPQKLFKSISFDGRSPQTENNFSKRDDWVHAKKDIRKVMRRLRSGHINVLLATTIIEEGIDVQACAYVVVFNGICTLKSYIQMKGRARQKNAKLFVFQNKYDTSKSLSLEKAKSIERKVNDFIFSSQVLRDQQQFLASTLVPDLVQQTVFDSSKSEIQAVQHGFYAAKNGRVTLGNAIGLLYHFALSQPMDPAVRKYKDSLQVHLPLYNDTVSMLWLPSFIGTSIRTIKLPDIYWDRGRKDKKCIMALMACVRLHQNGLLSDRLLPLTHSDIKERLLDLTEHKDLVEFIPIETPKLLPTHDSSSFTKVYEYTICLSGDGIDQARKALKSDGRRFAFVVEVPLKDMPSFFHNHPEFRTLTCVLGTPRETKYSSADLSLIADFYSCIMNARWKSRGKKYFFRPRSSPQKFPRILVGLLNANGFMDFEAMGALLQESKRSFQERAAAVQFGNQREISNMPRLWCPVYDEFNVYIVYGATEQKGGSPFPREYLVDNVETYTDYFKCRWKKSVANDSPLFLCQRFWKQPRGSRNDSSTPKPIEQMISDYDVCDNLCPVLLPREVCTEAPILACACTALEAVVLPQYLYFIERRLMATEFIGYCSQNFPELGRCLEQSKLDSVVELISAQSCSEDVSYERMEWLGDAVLQLVQTDAVLKSTGLKDWIANLHEGDLDKIRKFLVTNARLTSICNSLGLHQFILIAMLEKGLWVPSALEKFSEISGIINQERQPSAGVRADFLEAILAFVYKSNLQHGYVIASKVADELRITIPWSDNIEKDIHEECTSWAKTIEQKTKYLTGYSSFRNINLLEEAFTHPSDVSTKSSSYQRLEWIGDAVLSLAVRELIYDTNPGTQVGKMVTLATPLVANNSLAFLSLKAGLHKLMSHRDQTLPGRIEAYSNCVCEEEHGLFYTDPPKCIADIFESLIGAIYMDGGWHAGRRAALKLISPITCLSPEKFSRHPKRTLLEFGSGLISFSTDHDYEHSQITATVNFLGIDIVTVAESTAPAAIGLGVDIVLAVLDKNPTLKHRLIESKRRMFRALQITPRVATENQVEEDTLEIDDQIEDDPFEIDDQIEDDPFETDDQIEEDPNEIDDQIDSRIIDDSFESDNQIEEDPFEIDNQIEEDPIEIGA